MALPLPPCRCIERQLPPHPRHSPPLLPAAQRPHLVCHLGGDEYARELGGAQRALQRARVSAGRGRGRRRRRLHLPERGAGRVGLGGCRWWRGWPLMAGVGAGGGGGRWWWGWGQGLCVVSHAAAPPGRRGECAGVGPWVWNGRSGTLVDRQCVQRARGRRGAALPQRGGPLATGLAREHAAAGGAGGARPAPAGPRRARGARSAGTRARALRRPRGAASRRAGAGSRSSPATRQTRGSATRRRPGTRTSLAARARRPGRLSGAGGRGAEGGGCACGPGAMGWRVAGHPSCPLELPGPRASCLDAALVWTAPLPPGAHVRGPAPGSGAAPTTALATASAAGQHTSL